MVHAPCNNARHLTSKVLMDEDYNQGKDDWSEVYYINAPANCVCVLSTH